MWKRHNLRYISNCSFSPIFPKSQANASLMSLCQGNCNALHQLLIDQPLMHYQMEILEEHSSHPIGCQQLSTTQRPLKVFISLFSWTLLFSFLFPLLVLLFFLSPFSIKRSLFSLLPSVLFLPILSIFLFFLLFPS